MYRIRLKDSNKLINSYLETDKFMEKVGNLMRSYMTISAWDYKYYGQKSVRLKVNPNSASYRFLEKYSHGEDLKRLLSGDFSVQLEIIKDVFQGIPNASVLANNNKKHFQTIIHRKDDIPKDGTETDDFNSIMRHLFEDTIYDGTEEDIVHIDKYRFVENLGLKVCPYCGRSYIYSVNPIRKNKGVKVKPQIDHFLPKSTFPFLALNFYNMIPCCSMCNMAPAKKDQSPMIEIPKEELRIMQPYMFDDKSITFEYNPKSEAPLDASEISVSVNYHGNDSLKNGYNDLFFIDALYAGHNLEAHDIYIRMKTWKSKAKQAYKSLGLPDDYLEMLPFLFFGYSFEEDQARLRPLFKFYKDVYRQMLEDFKTGKIR